MESSQQQTGRFETGNPAPRTRGEGTPQMLAGINQAAQRKKRILTGLGIALAALLIFLLGYGFSGIRSANSPTAGFIGINGEPTNEENQIAGSAASTGASGTSSTGGASAGQFTGLLRLVLELRTKYLQNDTVATAERVTQIDAAVDAMQSTALGESWETLALCLARNCGANDFLEFIRTLAAEGAKSGMQHAQLIVDLITANKYWNSDNTVRFSEAVTAVDTSVNSLNQTALVSNWQAIVTCDGRCSTKTRLIFDFLQSLV